MKKRVLVLGLLLTLGLSGCMTLAIETYIKEDGSGSLTIVMAFNEKSITMMEEMAEAEGVEMGDPFAEMRTGLQEQYPDAKVEDYKQGEDRGVKIIFSFEDFEGLQALNQEMGLGNSTLTRDGDTMTYRVTVDPSQMTQDLSQAGEGEGVTTQDVDPEELDIHFTYAVKVDGKILSYGPGGFAQAKGNKVTWDLLEPPPDVQSLEFIVRWEPGASSSNLLLPILFVAIGVVLLLILVEVMRGLGERKRVGR